MRMFWSNCQLCWSGSYSSPFEYTERCSEAVRAMIVNPASWLNELIETNLQRFARKSDLSCKEKRFRWSETVESLVGLITIVRRFIQY